MLENDLNIPRRVRKRYERFVQKIEVKHMICSLSLQDFFNIYFSFCYYCDHNLDPNSHCSPDLTYPSREYNLHTVVAACPFCKNLKNSCKLSKTEAKVTIQTIVDMRNKNERRRM